jgi:hypothetical protein
MASHENQREFENIPIETDLTNPLPNENVLKDKLESLFNTINEISPLNEVCSYLQSPYVEDLLRVLDVLIKKAIVEKESLLREILELEDKIKEYSKLLKIDGEDLHSQDYFENLNLRREYLKNELKAILIKREKVEREIKSILEEIERYKEDLEDRDEKNASVTANATIGECEITPENVENTLNSDKTVNQNLINHQNLINQNENRVLANQNEPAISVDFLTSLKVERDLILIKIKELENKRQFFYDKIIEFSEKLGEKEEFNFSENICELKRKMEKQREKYENKLKTFTDLLEEIKRRENLLNFENKKIEFNLKNENLESIENYNKFLKDEQNRLFEEIYNRTLEDLIEINIILGDLKCSEYYLSDENKNEESLIKMIELLKKYENIKEKHCEIVENLTKRTILLNRMTEFEVIASDPKRLFKSSFQLNSEEKFRNTAYPSLLRIEESLIDQIEYFENAYGIFKFNDKPYKMALKHEIENRIINRTVFISRCDSPFWKKK